ncbi:MAG: hypothetical protein IJL87_00945 [Clostridia bacterium]|nr:hypothetical protein [Clostridia bacterium]
MKCSSCGSDMQNKSVCPVCGSSAKSGINTNGETKVYTGIDPEDTNVRKRSRGVLLVCAFIGGNDLYMKLVKISGHKEE